MPASAFETLVQQHQRRVYTFAHYFLADPGAAEDVTQEVLLRLWRHWESLEKERLGAWLTRVTRNACFDLLRRRRTARAVGLDPGAFDESERVESAEPDPERRARGVELRQRLEQSLAALDEPYRSIVILREVQGMAYQEIAEALDLPLNTVRVYLHRGRRRLREQLREVVDHA